MAIDICDWCGKQKECEEKDGEILCGKCLKELKRDTAEDTDDEADGEFEELDSDDEDE